jgi:hypothetical protein
VKDFMKVSCSKDDNQINEMILEAISFAEKFCGISIIQKHYVICYSQCAVSNNCISFPIRFIENIEKVSFFRMPKYEEWIIDEEYCRFDQDMQRLFLTRSFDFDILKVYFEAGPSGLDKNSLKSSLFKHVNILYKKRLPSTKSSDASLALEIEKLYLPHRLLRL